VSRLCRRTPTEITPAGETAASGHDPVDAVTAGAITRRLDRLQARGLVSRDRDRHDKRVIHVSLTSKGRDLIDEIVAGLIEEKNGLLTRLSEREHETLERLLTRWLSWLDENARQAHLERN
jgi:DNA-binding PadR family transcriptional regulator